MEDQIWQSLLSLESRDIVADWFMKLHGREVNNRRSKEIVAAARQAREFFRNSAKSDFSVKPLLTFYGVASLSRSLALLLKRDGGEESLTKSHGLETDSWSAILSSDVSNGLSRIGELKIRTTAGLFSDLISSTDNTMTLHVRSSAVDWRVTYPQPPIGTELQFADLLERLPDLIKGYSALGRVADAGSVNEMKFTDEAGFEAKIIGPRVNELGDAYAVLGYTRNGTNTTLNLSATSAIFRSQVPQFGHAYVDKMFGSIPHLYIVRPLPGGFRYSQLAMMYLLAYILGMLVRYFPTHWIALIQGVKGDALWPTINRAHHLVENSFPELVSEFLADALDQSAKKGV